MKKHVLIVLAVLIYLNANGNIVSPTKQAENNVIAHRGAWKQAGLPQNSLAALRRAIELNCAGSEFDVRITLDDSLVVVHDPVHEGLHVEKSTYDELIQKRLSNGEKIPTLRDYLTEGLTNNPSTLLVVEIKPSESGPSKGLEISEKVLKLIHKMKAREKVIYISFDYGILKRIKNLDPSASVHYLEGNKTPKVVFEDNLDGINFHYSVYQKQPDYIKEAKNLNLKVNSWTVNNEEVMDWLMAQDLDLITTDEPEILIQKYFEKRILKNRKLVWSDEFDREGSVDTEKWSYDTLGNSWSWGNNEKQWYTSANSKNATVKDGKLLITAIKEPVNGKQYSSARLITKQKGDWKYGVISVRAKVPAGNGTWPAIWMLPSNSSHKWPESGEIDIMEYIGSEPDNVFSTVHTKNFNHLIGTQVSNNFYLPNASTFFNVYTLVWEDHEIATYVNGVHYFSYKNKNIGNDQWPFDREFYLILNLAIGGGLGEKQGIDDNLFPHSLEIDFVRVYH
jgi:glycerophosphoryl diester phosphodiesterase